MTTRTPSERPDHVERAAHRLVILDRERLTVEFRDRVQFLDVVRGLKAGGYQVFSLQTDAPDEEPEAPKRGRPRKFPRRT